jgi:hypothetical protein
MENLIFCLLLPTALVPGAFFLLLPPAPAACPLFARVVFGVKSLLE